MSWFAPISLSPCAQIEVAEQIKVGDRSQHQKKTRKALREAGLQSESVQAPEGDNGFWMSLANLFQPSAVSASESGRVNSNEWLAKVVCTRVEIKRRKNQLYAYDITRSPSSVDALRGLYAQSRIASYVQYKHKFHRSANVKSLDQIQLGLFHAFTVLVLGDDAKDATRICVEKYADKLEIMFGTGSLMETYSTLFRANGEARPESDARPVVAEERVSLVGSSRNTVQVADLLDWVSGPVAMKFQPYCVLTQNCQHFARDLQAFLLGNQSLDDAKSTLSNDKASMMHAVSENGLALQFASRKIRSDSDVVAAAINANPRALEFASDELKRNHSFLVPLAQENGEIMVEAIRQTPAMLEFASERVKDDYEFVRGVVSKSGIALAYASDRLRADRDIVNTAVNQNAGALKYASDGLKHQYSMLRSQTW